MQNRLEIEQAILSAIIYCDGYGKIAHVLSPKNFTSSPAVKYRELFEAASRLYPDRPIDILTVSREIAIRYPDSVEMQNALFECGKTAVSSSSNIVYWAFILLQIDISEKYKAQLISWKSVRERELEHVEAAALQEVIETITPQQDIFEIIDKSILYFEKMNMQAELEEAKQFFKDISDRAQRIKRVDSIQQALRYIFRITETCNNQVKYECEKMAMAIADMVTTGQTNPRYTEAVNIIHR